MKLHRFARLRVRPAILGWLAIITGLALFIWDILVGGDFIVSKWPGRPMPFEMWLILFGLGWLALVAFYPELDRTERPEVALMWDASPDARTLSDKDSEFRRVFVLHNRSDEWIYNAEVHPVELSEELSFDKVHELGPHEKIHVIARWGEDQSSESKELFKFLCEGRNELAARKKKWQIEKQSRSCRLSVGYLRVPLRVTYNAGDRAWQAKFNFLFDPRGQSKIETLARRRL